MSSWSKKQRPITVAILALGGEGGGVLNDWIVATAESAGYYAQNTSVAGVAQRTGATVYYAELFPPAQQLGDDGPDAAASVRNEPVMSIFPAPGEVDVVITSELMECGRAIQRGFATPDRTTLITSTSRSYAIDEKMALGDGRVDDGELLAAARKSSAHLVATDFAQLATDANSVISASLFGGLAGSGALPFSRAQFEDSVRAFGKAMEPSLAAFAAGYEAAVAAIEAERSGAPAALPITTWAGSSHSVEAAKEQEETRRTRAAVSDPTALVGPALAPLARRAAALPEPALSMALHGLVRCAVYQDLAYAELYLAHVERLAASDRDRGGDARLTLEAARHIALWMCYQDTIQVAMQKSRRARMERVRKEAKVKSDQLFEVREFLHPQVEEITDTLPRALGEALLKSPTFNRVVGAVTNKGMILNTTSVLGYSLISTMARVRPLRRRSLRFVKEQQAIERWLAQALAVAPDDSDLAREIIECQGVLKGYGSTHAHGSESFAKLMRAANGLAGSAEPADRLASLREAALADEDGVQLDALLAELGSQPTAV